MAGPFDDLDRDPSPSAPRRDRPSGVRVLARGLRRRCPRCGSGTLFESRFRIRSRCPRCRLPLEREEGGFLGAMVVNYGATAGAWVLLLVGWLIVDLPDVHVFGLTLASIALAIAMPLLFWRSSKSIWAAVDYLVYRTDPGYASEEAADRAIGNGG
ncbi:MAG TPA: DUF983 domain-containing protein, partial [Actinomycetota bacterium]|nr:DUF983 domain-containing protein [Actinomycetota bacterium]